MIKKYVKPPEMATKQEKPRKKSSLYRASGL
jgi:hypothetical protein